MANINGFIDTDYTNVGVNTTDIATNDTDIATNVTNIATNTTNIFNLETNMTNAQVAIINNTTNISSNDTDIATNTTNVFNLETNMTNAQVAIINNTTAIGTNATDITTNTNNITANNMNITANDVDIIALQGKTQYQSATSGTTTFTNVDATSYKEGLKDGELVKTVNSTTIYAGAGAGSSLTTPLYSVYLGESSGGDMVDSSFNTAVGYSTLDKQTTSYNTAIGGYALRGITGTTATQNTALGYNSMKNVDGSSSYNVCVGMNAGLNLTDCDGNVAVGFSNLSTTRTDLDYTTAIGYNVECSGSGAIGIGSNVVAVTNTAVIGDASIVSMSSMGDGVCDLGTATTRYKKLYVSDGLDLEGTSTENGVAAGLVKTISTSTFAGTDCGTNLTTGQQNVLLGYENGRSLTDKHNCISIGYRAMDSVNQHYNIAIGSHALECITGTMTGEHNTAIGWSAMRDCTGDCNKNVCVGWQAGYSMDDNVENTFIGFSNNNQANQYSQCVSLGYNTDNGGDNTITIGSNTTTTSVNTAVIGDASIVSMSSMGNGVCSLGTSSKPYKELHVSDGLKLKQSVGNTSTIISHADYSNMYPADMLSSITALGGTNRCWGHTETYIAQENILAGRILTMYDTGQDTDSSNYLKVGYYRSGIETDGSVFPIGISQHNVSAGSSITVCSRGLTSVILATADSHPDRGSMVIAGLTAVQGKAYIATAATADQGRIGFVAQSNAVAANGPCLIYFRGWFQS
jgi:hypothetical protein